MPKKRSDTKSLLDLNSLRHFIRRHGKELERPAHVRSSNVEVYFDHIEQALVEHITKAEAIFGCIAWLTNESILRALAGRHTSVLIQKEDFLRPDFPKGVKPKTADYFGKLRELYSELWCTVSPWDIEMMGGSHLTRELGYCLTMDQGGTLQPIQCIGNARRGKAQAEALLHHKFAVLCSIDTEFDEQHSYEYQIPRPYAVWTGSFNFSHNATRSLENGLIIEDETLALAFFNEYLYWYPFAEPLNWQSEWMDDFNIRGPKS